MVTYNGLGKTPYAMPRFGPRRDLLPSSLPFWYLRPIQIILMPTNDFKIFGLCYDGHWCRLNGDVDEYEVARCFVCSSGGTSGNPPKNGWIKIDRRSGHWFNVVRCPCCIVLRNLVSSTKLMWVDPTSQELNNEDLQNQRLPEESSLRWWRACRWWSERGTHENVWYVQ